MVEYDPKKHVIVNTQNQKVHVFGEDRRGVIVQPIRNVDEYGRPYAADGTYVLEGQHWVQFIGSHGMGPLSLYDRSVAEAAFKGRPFPGPDNLPG